MKNNRKLYALLVLMLIVPIPSFGTAMGMIVYADSIAGKIIFGICKAWLLAVPLLWLLLIDKGTLSWSPACRGGFGIAIATGIAISAVIVAAYFLLGPIMIGDPVLIREMAAETGLSNQWAYIGGAAYWITVNSMLEEYIWRWFVVRRCEELMTTKVAIPVSALFFTIHHIVAMQIYFSWPVTIIAAFGIFIGGATWSWLYVRYNSIWPGYVSHAIVDIAIFAIGYIMIFG